MRTLGKSLKNPSFIRNFLALVAISVLCWRNFPHLNQLPLIKKKSVIVSESSGKRAVIVYIAGRNPEGGGDSSIIDELHLSVRSACLAMMHSGTTYNLSTSTRLPELNFLIFVSEIDYKMCTTSQCDYTSIERSCHELQPSAVFRYEALDKRFLSLWKNHTGIISFSHHSTWYGYAKVWLPTLLTSNVYGSYSAAMFVDTDTLWNCPPSIIFDELQNFNSAQVIGATSLVERKKHNHSLSFSHRVTSGVLLMDLKKLDQQKINWASIVADSIASNRGVGVGMPIPVDYNQSDYCEGFHWGPYMKPFCLVDPYLSEQEGCDTPHMCWRTSAAAGDQEFFSAIFSNSRTELLYELPERHQLIAMGPIDTRQQKLSNLSSVIHAPAIQNLWSEKIHLNNSQLAELLPPLAYESIKWFRLNVKNITY